MSNAWDTTIEDVEIAMWGEFLTTLKTNEQIFSELTEKDICRIENSALSGNDMEEQTQFAMEELENILRGKGIKL